MGFTWSVHRAHTIFGFATSNAINMVLTLCYATICRETGRPLHLPGFGHPGFVAVNAGMETAQWRR